MAKGALAAGFAAQNQGGGRRGSGSTPGFADIAFRAGDIAERKKIREQDAQEKFTQARKDFEKEQADLYGALVYEDQFTDTGITDVDEAGQKLASVLKSEYEMTNQLYRMGKIDENEVRRRNTRMKGQIGQLKSGVFEKISAFKEELDKKIQAGTDSEADHMKLRQLEDMTENVAFGVDANGNVEIRTPGTGEVAMEIGEGMTKREARRNVDMSKATRIPMSKLSSLLQNEPGADLNAMTDRITSLEKAGDIYRAGSREYTRYTQPDGDGGRKLSPDQDELMSIAIKGLSQTEKLDALKKLNADFNELGITDNDVLGYEDNPEKVKAIDDALKQGLNNKLMNELRAMESSRPYDDPMDKARQLAAIRSNEKRRVDTNPILGEDASDSKGDRIQIVPRDLEGIKAAGLTEEDRFKKDVEKEIKRITGLYPGLDPASVTYENARVVQAQDFIDDGYMEVEFEYEVQIPQFDQYNRPTGKFKKEKRQTKINYKDVQDRNKFYSGFGLKGISSKNFYEERAREKKGEVTPFFMNKDAYK